jgi:hypothetical protein
MKLEDIHEQWATDCQLNIATFDNALNAVPLLHSKYLRIMSDEKMVLRRMEESRKELVKLKHDWFRGILPEEDMKEQGWQPNRLSILKSDIPMHMDADKDVITMNLKLSLQQEKVDVLEQIIRHISNRGYLMKTMLDWERFKVGA